jgi:hypothetical protein
VNAPADSQNYSIHAFNRDGSERDGWPRQLAGGAQGFTLAPDGTVVAWWYEGVAEGEGLDARRTVFTMIAPDGGTLAGWPVGSTGAASGPVVWNDDSLYYTSATGKVWANDRNGARIAGWPYQLGDLVAPKLRSDGMLVFVGESSVAVLDRAGHVLPGWPYRTRSSLSWNNTCDTPSYSSSASALEGDGILYLAPWDGTRSSIVALDPGGQVVQGWPYVPPSSSRRTKCDPDTTYMT